MAGEVRFGAVGADWETFTGVDAYGQQVSPLSPIDRRLDEVPDCSIEELLDEDELVPEFRAGNARLIERICHPDALRRLVECVTREPREDLPEDCRCRRPYVAAELLTCNTERIFEAFALPGSGDEILGLLWSFMDSPAARPAAPALAGYFCSIATSLFARRPVEMAGYLRQHCPSELLEHFLERLELRCFAELLAHLLCAEVPSHLVFPHVGLVQRLAACFNDDECPCAVHEHAAFLLDHLLARACVGDLCYSGELLRQFTVPGVVTALVDRVLSAGAAAGPAAAVLSSAVCHLHLLPSNPLLPARSPELQVPARPPAPAPRPAPPQRPSAPTGERDPQPANEGSPLGTSDARLGLDKEEVPGISESATCGSAQLDVAGAALVDELCTKLPHLCGVLEAATTARTASASPEQSQLAQSPELDEAILLLLQSSCISHNSTAEAGLLATRLSELSTRPGARELRDALERHGWAGQGSRVPHPTGGMEELLKDLRQAAQFRRVDAARTQPRSGGMVLEILCLFALLVKTGRAIVFEAMLVAEVLPRCLEMLLACATSSVLQNAVWAVFSEVIGNKEQGLQSVLALLGLGPLMLRVVAEQHRGSEARVAAAACDRGPKGSRAHAGYAGHLRGICAELSRLGATVPEVATALARIEGWSEIVLPEIETVENLESEPLGGQHPEATGSALPNIERLMALNSAMSDASDEVELSLEDIRDINEELDEQQMLDLADVQRRRRAKAFARAGRNLPEEDPLDAEEPGHGESSPGGQAAAELP